jgi:hypothetical protein
MNISQVTDDMVYGENMNNKIKEEINQWYHLMKEYGPSMNMVNM